MSSDESHEPRAPADGPDVDNDLGRPVDPPTLMGRITSGEQHLTRRVIAPLALLIVAVPVVALLVFNLRTASDSSTPASAETEASSSATPAPTPSTSPTPAPTTPAPTTPAPSTPAPTTPAPAPSGPSITAVAPTTGPAAGGTVLTVRGADLDAVTQVLFGALNGANLQHVSDTELRVVAPAGARGTVALAFKTGADEARTAVTRFTYS